MFVNPNINQLKYLKKLETKPGIAEIYTGDYCNNPLEEKLKLITNATDYMNKLGIECHAKYSTTYKHAQKTKKYLTFQLLT